MATGATDPISTVTRATILDLGVIHSCYRNVRQAAKKRREQETYADIVPRIFN